MSSLREINIKRHGFCYHDGKINIKDLDLNKISVCGKPYHNNFVYQVAYKILLGEKPLCISMRYMDI